MSMKKRTLETQGHSMAKKKKLSHPKEPISSSKPTAENENAPNSSTLDPFEVDFPRGGAVDPAIREKNDQAIGDGIVSDDVVFKDGNNLKKSGKKRRQSDVGLTNKKKKQPKSDASDNIRIEQLNYKRLTIGMKILCQIVSVHALALIVALPDQLFGHVPITQISSYYTALLQRMSEDNRDVSVSDVEEEEESSAPNLGELFRPGQYVRAVVTAIRPSGTRDAIGPAYTMDETEKASRRVELSLDPAQLNTGIAKSDLKTGDIMTGAIKSVEDHGYIVDFGVPDISGFLSYENATHGPFLHPGKLPVGRLLDVVIGKIADTERTCEVKVNPSFLQTSFLKGAVNVAALVPGCMVQAVVSDVRKAGLRLLVLGVYAGTVDKHHLPSHDPEAYKAGQKVKARLLYNIDGSSPPQFALSLLPHVKKLDVKRRQMEEEESEAIQDAYPIGTIFESTKVVEVQPERGLIVEIEPGLYGFVHISHVSDDHVPSLSSNTGKWKYHSTHQARVTGYHTLDGLLLLSLRTSVLEKKFLQVSDVHVGELLKGTIKHLTDRGLFVSISGSIDGVVWPNHFADIPLKHPERRFKPGATLKCRVLAVDSDRKRILLTAKKSLVNSDLPVIASVGDAKVGTFTYGTVAKVSEKGLIVEFYNHVKALVPTREATETPSSNLSDIFNVGKPVKVRILACDIDSERIIATVRQTATEVKEVEDHLNAVDVGNTVSGVITDVHKDNVVLRLDSSGARALISINNLANHRGIPASQLRVTLKKEEKLENLLVVSRNPEKGIVIVSTQQFASTDRRKNLIEFDSLQLGDTLSLPVLRHDRRGTILKLNGRATGVLHPTDTADNYDKENAFPPVESIVKVVVIGINRGHKRAVFSARLSRMEAGNTGEPVDREIKSVQDLQVGDIVRGFVKNIVDHGLFVTLGRDIDARVQIKELFDEYVKEWKPHFQVNQLVKGRIVSLDAEKKQIEMSFRTKSKSETKLLFEDLFVGQEHAGHVKRVEEYGIFIHLTNSKLTGLCHKSEITDNSNASVETAMETYREGDQVQVVILALDAEKRRISLGMKPSYFQDSHKQESNNLEEDVEKLGVVSNSHPQAVEAEAHVEPAVLDTEDKEDSDDEVDVIKEADLVDTNTQLSTMPPVQEEPRSKAIATLSLGDFQWTNANDDGSDDEKYALLADDVTQNREVDESNRKSKQASNELTAETDTRRLESTSDFERHLMGSPDSSYLWIRYMAFQIQFSEIDKARAVGKRALQTINFRQEQEKLNVWIALLNLENTYGTDESLEATFKDAARHNDSKTVHLHLAAILEQSDKHEHAEELFQKTCKKFGQSSKVWCLFGEYFMRRGKLEDARALLARSLLSLEKRKHLKTISKYGQMEYKYGSPERGKSIFEGIVESHPKRWDLWSVYIDMEAGQKDIQSVRQIFAQVLSRKLTSYKAKSFFKKWLSLETRIGDEEGVQRVKEKAVEWTQNAANS